MADIATGRVFPKNLSSDGEIIGGASIPIMGHRLASSWRWSHDSDDELVN